MSLENDFLKTAHRLLNPPGRGRPRQADLRRAVSTAYYAVFHALCRLCADVIIGTRRDTRRAWRQVYRAVQHGQVKQQCSKGRISNLGFPPEIKAFCAMFLHLQEKRHEADYDPFARLTLKDAQELVILAERAVKIINDRNIDGRHKRALVAWILLPKKF